MQSPPPEKSACQPSSSSTSPPANLSTCTPTCPCALEGRATVTMTVHQITQTSRKGLEGLGKWFQSVTNAQTDGCIRDLGEIADSGAFLGIYYCTGISSPND
ncbi:hypothetical protein LDENG_00282560 [Lucifuga dentata]|nr:hypothetical protein LDENG_00282560 [Lucifuga dentata]